MTSALPARRLRSALMDEIEAVHGLDALAAGTGGEVDLAIWASTTAGPFDPWCVLSGYTGASWSEVGRLEEFGDALCEVGRLLDLAAGSALTVWGSDARPAIVLPCELGRDVLWRDDRGVRMSTQLASGLHVLSQIGRFPQDSLRRGPRVLTGLVDENDLWWTFEQATHQLAVEADWRG